MSSLHMIQVFLFEVSRSQRDLPPMTQFESWAWMKFDVIFSLEFHSKLRSDESRKNKHRRCVCKHQGRICFTTSEGSLRLPSGLSQCIVKIYHPVFSDTWGF